MAVFNSSGILNRNLKALVFNGIVSTYSLMTVSEWIMFICLHTFFL